MSKVFNMVGGGSGKNISSIIINGLGSTDAVTCTKDDKTYPATWDETAQHWEIVGLPLGTFTVTATNGAKTTTETVLIDITGVYEIEMSYVLWLYKEGDKCEDVTGGWTENFRFSSWTTNELRPVEFLDDCIKCDTSKYSGAGGYTIVGTYNKINFSGYTKLHTEIDVISTSKGKDWPSFVGSIVAENPFSASSNGFAVFGSALTATGVMTYEVDITSYTDERYVVIMLNSISQSGRNANFDIKKVWLE